MRPTAVSWGSGSTPRSASPRGRPLGTGGLLEGQWGWGWLGITPCMLVGLRAGCRIPFHKMKIIASPPQSWQLSASSLSCAPVGCEQGRSTVPDHFQEDVFLVFPSGKPLCSSTGLERERSQPHPPSLPNAKAQQQPASLGLAAPL